MDFSSDCVQSIRQLCIDVINKLDELREKDLITDEEYTRHTYLKQQFLKDTEYTIPVENVNTITIIA